MDVHIISNKLILRRFSSQLREDCMWRYNRTGLQFFWCPRRPLKCVLLNTQTYTKEIFKNGQNLVEVGGLNPHASIILLEGKTNIQRRDECWGEIVPKLRRSKAKSYNHSKQKSLNFNLQEIVLLKFFEEKIINYIITIQVFNHIHFNAYIVDPLSKQHIWTPINFFYEFRYFHGCPRLLSNTNASSSSIICKICSTELQCIQGLC